MIDIIDRLLACATQSIVFSCCFSFNIFWENITWNLTQAGSNNDLDYKIFSENMQFWSHISSINILYIIIYINWSWKFFVVPINLSRKLFQFLIFSEYTIILSTPPLFHSSCVFRFSNCIVIRENTRVCVSFAF